MTFSLSTVMFPQENNDEPTLEQNPNSDLVRNPTLMHASPISTFSALMSFSGLIVSDPTGS